MGEETIYYVISIIMILLLIIMIFRLCNSKNKKYELENFKEEDSSSLECTQTPDFFNFRKIQICWPESNLPNDEYQYFKEDSPIHLEQINSNPPIWTKSHKWKDVFGNDIWAGNELQHFKFSKEGQSTKSNGCITDMFKYHYKFTRNDFSNGNCDDEFCLRENIINFEYDREHNVFESIDENGTNTGYTIKILESVDDTNECIPTTTTTLPTTTASNPSTTTASEITTTSTISETEDPPVVFTEPQGKLILDSENSGIFSISPISNVNVESFYDVPNINLIKHVESGMLLNTKDVSLGDENNLDCRLIFDNNNGCLEFNQIDNTIKKKYCNLLPKQIFCKHPAENSNHFIKPYNNNDLCLNIVSKTGNYKLENCNNQLWNNRINQDN